MRETFYKIIYSGKVNWILRNINKSFSFIFPFKIPPSGIITIRIDKNTHFKMFTNQSNYLTKIVFWDGYDRFEYSSVFIDLIKKVSTFFDIGANIGYYSLLASSVNKNIKVVGFEPATGPLSYFRKNVLVNNFSQIEVEPIALSDKKGEIDFYEICNPKYKYLKTNLAGESNIAGNVENRKYTISKVPTITLDDYVISRGYNSIELIKIDTEGSEHLIFGYADYILSNMKPIVICETLFGRNEKELEQIFSKHGYWFFSHTANGLKKTETLIRERDNGVYNCFFVHPTKLDLIGKYILK